MTCRNVTEKLVESARHEVEAGKPLKAHTLSCPGCRERLEAEEHLTAHLKVLRAAAWDQRSPAESRDMLMARFAARNRPAAAPKWYWALGMAAALVVSVFAVPDIGRRLWPQNPEAAAVAPADTDDEAALADVQSGDPETEGFIAVPYVPPLATGEMVRVVHTELNPAALASLGVNVDPSWTAQLPADLLLGEDGMPRAVRVFDATSSNGGF